MNGVIDELISLRLDEVRDVFFAFHKDLGRAVSSEDWYRFQAQLVDRSRVKARVINPTIALSRLRDDGEQ